MPSKYWRGLKPDKCQLCGRKLAQQFVDGRLRTTGQWAIVCPTCYHTHGSGFGLGRGQRYDLNTLEKVAG